MHKLHAQVRPALAMSIIVILSGAVVFFSYEKSPELRQVTANTFRLLVSDARDFFNLGKYTRNDSHYAVIIDDAGHKTQVLILEPTDATSTNQNAILNIPIATSTDDQPTELETFKPSPESEWARVYLQMLNIGLEDLALEIGYVRE
jgi:hypothetical protein